MVMIRSVEPGRGSSMVMLAPESPRILRIRAPPLPIIAPANWNKKKPQKLSLRDADGKIQKEMQQQLTSFGMETWVVSVWPRSSSRKIRSSWYILGNGREAGEKKRNELQAANDGRIEISRRHTYPPGPPRTGWPTPISDGGGKSRS